MTACPLCWLRAHGYKLLISNPHTKADWEWLEKNRHDLDVQMVLDTLPSGVLDDDEERQVRPPSN